MSSRRSAPPRRRDGTALVAALLALTVGALLGAGVFLSAWRDQRAGSDALRRVRALAAAEYGLEHTLAPERWDVRWNRLPGLAHIRSDSLPDRSSDTVRVWTLTTWSVLGTSEGIAIDGSRLARRRIARLAALRVPSITWPAVVVSRGAVTVRSRATVHGADSAADTDCVRALGVSPPSVAIAVPPSDLVDTSACEGPCLFGAPPVLVTSEADGAIHSRLGGMERAAIVSAADARPAGIALRPRPTIGLEGTCDVADPDNFGDPFGLLGASSPCREHAPLVFMAGDARLTGGVGQGLLVVDGDLSLENDARFDGIVMVRGTVRLGGAARIDGVVIAGAAQLEDAGAIGWSACGVLRALHALARPAIVAGPGWVEMP